MRVGAIPCSPPPPIPAVIVGTASQVKLWVPQFGSPGRPTANCGNNCEKFLWFDDRGDIDRREGYMDGRGL